MIFEEDLYKVLKIAGFTTEMSCVILGCSSEKRYKTTLPDLKLCISRKKICFLYSALSLAIESKLFFSYHFKSFVHFGRYFISCFQEEVMNMGLLYQLGHSNRSC